MNSKAREFEIVVVGGGPAGLAAAAAARESGTFVALLDDNPQIGGQIWRASIDGIHPEAAGWARKLEAYGVEVFRQARVFDADPRGVLFAETPNGVLRFGWKNLILATGARERFLPFPGWTLPNVMGAGGLQALVKGGLPIAGKRVVVAGSGPLLLAVAAYLREHGACIPLVAEQAPWRALASFGLELCRRPRTLFQATRLWRALRGVRFSPNSWPVRALGSYKMEAVEMRRRGRTETITCEYLACGFHLVPNIELAAHLGCVLRGGFVLVDKFLKTSVPGVFCAGEPAGIGGLDRALLQGQIAGLAAAGRPAAASDLVSKARRSDGFVRSLAKTFALRDELKCLAQPDTVVCRCEDVAYSQLCDYNSRRAGKLHARCGMGPCQGRICGPAVEFILGWQPDLVRPPILPVSVEALAAASESDLSGEHT
jgi:NADPH-dependent 2,4-dienoyl-CoA reductase/sulfur reductase-like enzyme